MDDLAYIISQAEHIASALGDNADTPDNISHAELQEMVATLATGVVNIASRIEPLSEPSEAPPDELEGYPGMAHDLETLRSACLFALDGLTHMTTNEFEQGADEPIRSRLYQALKETKAETTRTK